VTVVAALELEDAVSSREGPGNADGAHGGLGPGRDEPDQFDRRDRVGNFLGKFHFALGRSAEARAVARSVGDRVDRLGVGVPEDERAPRHHPVDVPVAFDVLEICALSTRDEERVVVAHGAPRANGRVDAAGDQTSRPSEERRPGS
jgi:hypothetical protein